MPAAARVQVEPPLFRSPTSRIEQHPMNDGVSLLPTRARKHMVAESSYAAPPVSIETVAARQISSAVQVDTCTNLSEF
jgi:hypothetical protein